MFAVQRMVIIVLCYSQVTIPTIKENLFRCADDNRMAFRFAAMNAVFLTYQCISDTNSVQALFTVQHKVLELEVRK